jgi:hypothetical protein
MAALTRTACRTRARFQLNEPVARFYTESALNDYCDDAVRDISLRAFCLQYICTAINTTSGVNSYVFPILYGTTAIETIGVKTVLDSANVSLAYISPDLIGKIGENPAERKWTYWARQVIISPVPTATISLRFLVWVEGSQSAASTINLPTIYHHLVPLYMVYKAHEAKRNFVLAAKVFKEYEDELMRILQILHGTDNPATNIKPGTPVQTVSS